ncbi:MAG: hypothetical protein JNM20_06635 [Rhizobiales bacterium]|nr:hypothetical protein [Hyphomicrobiales bacterium]
MARLGSDKAADLLRKLLKSRESDEGFVAAELVVEASSGKPDEDADRVYVLVITVEDRASFHFPEELRADGIDFLVRIEEGPPAKLLAPDQSRLPVPPRGRITGGDAIWNPNGGWGTMAFATPTLTFVDHQDVRQVVNNAVVSCNHILAMLDLAQLNDQIVTFRKQVDLWLEYYWPVQDAAYSPVDIAVGQSSNLTAFAQNEVRGLGQVRGVTAAVDRERVFKCGAATSITTARDDGVGAIRMPYYKDRTVWLRKTTPDFADVGDSGSAVLNSNRELIGFVVAGRQTAAGIVTYYLPTAPLNASPSADPLLRLSLS